MRQAWLSIYSTVEELYVWSTHQPSHDPIVTLPPRCPSDPDNSFTRSMSLSEQDHENFHEELSKPPYHDSQFFPPGWDDAMFPNLKVLCIAGHMNISPENFLRLVTRCPNLQSVQLPDLPDSPVPSASATPPNVHHPRMPRQSLTSQEILEQLPLQFCEKVERIWFGRIQSASMTGLIFRRLHRLRRIVLERGWIEDKHLAMLIQQHPALEELSIGFCRPVSSDALWAFLSLATKLKRLRTSGISLKIPRLLLDYAANQSSNIIGYGQQATQEVPLVWACRGLEMLAVEFYVTMDSVLTSRAIFALLSQFPKLKYLRIDHTTLILSEAGGLHQLATLRRLEDFVLQNTNYAELARDDVHWMIQHWPHLQRLHLGVRSASQKEVIQEWAEEYGREKIVQYHSPFLDL